MKMELNKMQLNCADDAVVAVFKSALANKELLDVSEEDTSLVSDCLDEDTFVCDNCGEVCDEEDECTNDMITGGGHYRICNQCVTDGYAS